MDRRGSRPHHLPRSGLLAKFLSAKGKIRSRRQTGLPRVWQARMAREVKHARELALLPVVVDAPEKPRRGRREERD